MFKCSQTIMKYKKLTLLLLFLPFVILAQEPIEKCSQWQYDGFSYADFGTGEEHSYFSISRQLSSQFYVELRGFYDKYRVSNIFDLSSRVKWHPTKKLYFFSGIGIQKEQKIGGQGLQIMPVRMLNGVGYELKKNINFEAVHDLNFNANSAGLNATPSLFTLRGKYRF